MLLAAALDPQIFGEDGSSHASAASGAAVDATTPAVAAAALAARAVDETFERFPMPPEVRGLVERCLHVEVSQRPRDASTVLSALEIATRRFKGHARAADDDGARPLGPAREHKDRVRLNISLMKKAGAD